MKRVTTIPSFSAIDDDIKNIVLLSNQVEVKTLEASKKLASKIIEGIHDASILALLQTQAYEKEDLFGTHSLEKNCMEFIFMKSIVDSQSGASVSQFVFLMEKAQLSKKGFEVYQTIGSGTIDIGKTCVALNTLLDRYIALRVSNFNPPDYPRYIEFEGHCQFEKDFPVLKKVTTI